MKKKSSYGSTARQGAIWALVRDGGHEAIAIPSSMIMARLLTPGEFGVTVAASFFVALATRLTQFGFGGAIVRVKELRPEHVSSVFVVSLAMGTSLYGALLLAAPYFGQWLGSKEAAQLLPVAALTFVFSPFSVVPNALLTRDMHFRHLTVADWFHKIVGVGATVGFALAGWSYWSVAYGSVAASGVRACLLAYLSGWRPSVKFSRTALKELFAFGLGLQTRNIVEYASYNVDNLIVGRLLGMTSLGYYDKAFATMERLSDRLALGQAPFRIFSIIHQDVLRFQRAYSRLMLGVMLIAYPAFAAAITVAKPLFIVMYGERWLPSVVPFQLLCLGGFLKLLNGYGAQANEAAGQIWAQVVRQTLGAVLIVVGAALGSTYGGTRGAALGVALAMAVVTVAMQALVRRATHLTWGQLMAPHLPGFVSGLALAAVLWVTGLVVTRWWPATPALALLAIQALVGACFYAAAVLFSPFASVREIVLESVDELPAPGRRMLLRILRPRSA